MGYIISLPFIVFVVWIIHGAYQILTMPVSKNEYVDPIVKCESPIERRLYLALANRGLHPTPQYQVGRYRIDLAFPHKMLAIECDGKAYHSTPSQKAHDRKRDKFLRNHGWTVLRFSGSRIHRDLGGIVKKIEENLYDR